VYVCVGYIIIAVYGSLNIIYHYLGLIFIINEKKCAASILKLCGCI